MLGCVCAAIVGQIFPDLTRMIWGIHKSENTCKITHVWNLGTFWQAWPAIWWPITHRWRLCCDRSSMACQTCTKSPKSQIVCFICNQKTCKHNWALTPARPTNNLNSRGSKVHNCPNKPNNLSSKGSKVCNYIKKQIKPILRGSWSCPAGSPRVSKTLLVLVVRELHGGMRCVYKISSILSWKPSMS